MLAFWIEIHELLFFFATFLTQFNHEAQQHFKLTVLERSFKVHSLLQLHVVVIDNWSAFSSVHHHPLQTDFIYNKDNDSAAAL